MKNLFLIFLGITLSINVLSAQEMLFDNRDGNIYNTVAIGSQIWMAENLKYLPHVVGPATFSNTIPYCYVYGYDGTDVLIAKGSANYQTYGVLYNWAAAMDGSTSSDLIPSGVKGICPEGWHLPSDFEWLYLAFYLVGDSLAGGKMKEEGTLHWNLPNTGATNSSGFTALPGGFLSNVGAFYDIGRNSIWWSTTEFNTTRAYYRNIIFSSAYLYRYDSSKEYGYSVRCMKNVNSNIQNINENLELKIYPNPANDVITFYLPNIFNAKLKIYDTNGKCLFTSDLKNEYNVIDISFLTKGIYLIQVNDYNKIFQGKFMKE